MKIKFYLIILIFLFSTNVCAKQLVLPNSFIHSSQGAMVDFSVTPLSTEIMLGRIKNMVETAPRGAYISIGGERSFRGASMANNIDKLILLDIAEPIIRFGKINRELLKAPTREQYLFLRWHANYYDWYKHKLAIEKQTSNFVHLTQDDYAWWLVNVRDLKTVNFPFPEKLNRFGANPDIARFIELRDKIYQIQDKLANEPGVNLISSSGDEKFISYKALINLLNAKNINIDFSKGEYDLWEKHVITNPSRCFNALLNNPNERVDLGKIIDYKTGNYLFYNDLYNKLHELAINQQIFVTKIDLFDLAQVSYLVQTLKNFNVKISVLDLNNLYQISYIGQDKYRNLVYKFLRVGLPDSRLIVMNNRNTFACAQIHIYLGFSFENIINWPISFNIQKFFKTLPNDVYPLLDGRLYEVGQMPPIKFYN